MQSIHMKNFAMKTVSEENTVLRLLRGEFFSWSEQAAKKRMVWAYKFKESKIIVNRTYGNWIRVISVTEMR